MPENQDEARKDADLVQLKLRFREATRAKIEAAAKASGNSLNAEIVSRLERSLNQDAQAGGSQNQRLFNRLADAIDQIQNLTGKTWTADPATYVAVRRALWHEMSEVAPPIVNESDVVEALKARTDALEGITVLLRIRNDLRDPEAAQARFEAIHTVLTGSKPKGRLSMIAATEEELATAIADLEQKAEAARQRELEALRPQREAERKGREIHRNWRKAKKARRESYGA